ncbi:MAG: VCBS repeat-containing protein [Fibrobacterales bacterium]
MAIEFTAQKINFDTQYDYREIKDYSLMDFDLDGDYDIIDVNIQQVIDTAKNETFHNFIWNESIDSISYTKRSIPIHGMTKDINYSIGAWDDSFYKNSSLVDFDNDGDLDLILNHTKEMHSALWLRNENYKHFTLDSLNIFPDTRYRTTLIPCDLNGDGQYDFIKPGIKINIFLSSDSGIYTKLWQNDTNLLLSTITDFDNDSDFDLIINGYTSGAGNYGTNKIWLLENNGSGTFTDSTTIVKSFSRVSFIELSNIDGFDGNDLLYESGSTSNGSSYLYLIDKDSTLILGRLTSTIVHYTGHTVGYMQSKDFMSQVAYYTMSAGIYQFESTDLSTDISNSIYKNFAYIDGDGRGLNMKTPNYRILFIFDIDRDGDLDILTEFESKELVIFRNPLFQLGPSVLRLKPSINGLSVVAGDTLSITWESTPNIESINLSYYTENRTTTSIVKNLTNQNTYDWIVPQETADSVFIILSGQSDKQLVDKNSEQIKIIEHSLSSSSTISSSSDLQTSSSIEVITTEENSSSQLAVSSNMLNNLSSSSITIDTINSDNTIPVVISYSSSSYMSSPDQLQPLSSITPFTDDYILKISSSAYVSNFKSTLPNYIHHDYIIHITSETRPETLIPKNSVSYHIISIHGAVLSRGQINDNSEFHIPDLSNGIYILRFSNK